MIGGEARRPPPSQAALAALIRRSSEMSTFWKKLAKTAAGLVIAVAVAVGATDVATADEAPQEQQSEQAWGHGWS